MCVCARVCEWRQMKRSHIKSSLFYIFMWKKRHLYLPLHTFQCLLACMSMSITADNICDHSAISVHSSFHCACLCVQYQGQNHLMSPKFPMLLLLWGDSNDHRPFNQAEIILMRTNLNQMLAFALTISDSFRLLSLLPFTSHLTWNWNKISFEDFWTPLILDSILNNIL